MTSPAPGTFPSPAPLATAAGAPTGGRLPGDSRRLPRWAFDLSTLVAVAVVVAVIVAVRSRVEYPVPVSHGAGRVVNPGEIVADAERRFDELVSAQGGSVGAGASCWFYRPMGATLGVLPADMFPDQILGYLPGGRDAEGIDLMLCGPVRLGTAAAGTPPWLAGIVTYRSQADGGYQGDLAMVMPAPVLPMTGAGGVTSEHLVGADGHHPESGLLADPQWREVEPSDGAGGGTGLPVPGTQAPTGEPGTPGPPMPPGGPAPPSVSLPPGVTLPPGVSLPPGMTLPPGSTAPGEAG